MAFSASRRKQIQIPKETGGVSVDIAHFDIIACKRIEIHEEVTRVAAEIRCALGHAVDGTAPTARSLTLRPKSSSPMKRHRVPEVGQLRPGNL